MTVTKQQQLEWLAGNGDCWPGFMDREIRMCTVMLGWPNQWLGYHTITKQEWQQERDKMSSKPAPDNSWHERGEFPPVGCECEILGAFGHYQEWFPCKIIAEHCGSVFAANERAWINVKHGERKFRPIRTEREKAIDAACDAIGSVGEDGLLTIERLYDAGMLK